MSSVVIAGDTSGSVTLQAPSVAGSTTLTLPATSGNVLTSTSATVGSSGITFSDGSTQTAAASPYVLKNRIINGAMQVWQRGTSFTPTVGIPVYVADRFCSYNSNTSPTVSQSTDVPTGQGFKYSLKTQRAVSNTGTGAQYVAQAIESVNMLDLAGQTITFSFWAKAGANYSQTSNNLSVIVSTGTVADQGTVALFGGSITGVANVISSYVVLTTTWTKYSLSGAVGSNALEMFAYFAETPTGTAGADDSYYITGVQLEIGSTATPFERRLYNQELANCQRYLPAWNMTAANQVYGQGQVTSTAAGAIYLPFKVSARTAPTGVTASAAANFYLTTAGYSVAGTYVSTAFGYGSTEGITILCNCGSGLTQGYVTTLASNSTSSQILATGCEL